MGNDIFQRITIDDLLKREDFEGVVEAVPTGVYADRASYGNSPILAFVLNGVLPCIAKAYPYSHRVKIRKDPTENRNSLQLKVFRDYCADNENLALAAAFIDNAIRSQVQVEVHGSYEDGIFNTQYIKIGNRGFFFEGYQFPPEKGE